MNAARRSLALAAQARLDRVAAARRAFVRRPSPPAPWSAPRRRASSRCRCCCSAASRCWRPEVGAPWAHGPVLGPHPGPALPGSLQPPMLRSARCAQGGHRTVPRAAWNSGRRPPFPNLISGSAPVPSSLGGLALNLFSSKQIFRRVHAAKSSADEGSSKTARWALGMGSTLYWK